MAYQGGYPSQHAYGHGGAGPRPPPPRDPYQPGPPRHVEPPQQHYDRGYHDDYDYDHHDGYGQDYVRQHQHQDPGYGRGPPQNNQGYPHTDQYGPGQGRGDRPPPMGRGGPMPRSMTADPSRGGPYPSRGGHAGHRGGYANRPPPGGPVRPVQYERSANSDPPPHRQRPMGEGPRSPTSPTGFGGAFPTFPGHQRQADFDHENQMVNQMAGMDISQTTSTGHHSGSVNPHNMRSAAGPYGRPPVDPRGPPPQGSQQGYFDPRPGPGPRPAYGAEYRSDDGYGRPPPRDDFGPPSRSMTMPVNDPMARGPPQRTGTMPLNGPHVTGGLPPRPSTSNSHRPPTQRVSPLNQGTLPTPAGGYTAADSEYENADQGYYGGEAVGDVLDAYYTPARMSNPEYSRNPASASSDALQYDGPSMHRGSLGQHSGPAVPEELRPGPERVSNMSRAKSQPDLREPETAVFEMAGDAPPLPPMNNSYAMHTFDRHPSLGSQSATMAPRPGVPSNPSQSRGPDSLPSHPTPIRPGHMPNSMVNVHDRPAPVRNYNGSSGGPQQAQPIPQQQKPHTPQSAPSSAPATVPVTPEELEQLRVLIKNNPNDQESALRLAKRLIEASDVLVSHLPDPKSRARARERYLVDANKILKKLSSAQNVEAMFVYADSLGRGLFSLEPENKEAFTLYQSAAKLGHAAAAYRTAVCCEIGHEEGGGTRKDPLKAIQWYKRAATLGDTPAMYKMGMILLKGLLGQPKNPREAISWLKRAAERADPENPHALHELGMLYESASPNDVIIKDEAYAFQLFKQAAELGYKFSQFRLGCAYEYGSMGCPIDPRLSIMWYSKAATQEEHQAELALSGWYLTGAEGVLQQSDTEAYLWARKAAIAGLAKAEYAMGYFTEVGIGTSVNLEDAKRWYWRAAGKWPLPPPPCEAYGGNVGVVKMVTDGKISKPTAQDFPKARERLEDLKRTSKTAPRQRERVARTKLGKQQEVFR
ncbi:hypothetical protein SODALDRAFT_201517 [Sodiomyces alkalinus F11]|uniref:HCP-like protein n=1 Tax=Sodiomyces alkalinus (strain CBS 110278 / VKM F-3762 / F11) TaxID=1314773 RepID=A0A3N2PT08_SODAK|nr:hypothetical protein SODALDRAFT_201517 [Sodiomyces alkalinus F11]ROT37630.1 hypothetical protein SODALDRAFT_201517 [Sodiomyces alkalinus F11]